MFLCVPFYVLTVKVYDVHKNVISLLGDKYKSELELLTTVDMSLLQDE